MEDITERSRVVSEVLERRRSVRHFSDQPISSDALELLLQAGIAAPSGSNWQNQRFLPLQDPEEIEQFGRQRFVWPYRSDQAKMRERHPSGIIGNAQLVIVVFVDAAENDRRDNGEYYLWETLEVQNCAASIENILIQATALGIGSCWISASDKMNYTRLMGKRSWRSALPSKFIIPKTWKLQGIVALGYPLQSDELGYPKGEKMHGATQWTKTERQPINYYLPSETEGPIEPDLGVARRIFVRLGALSIRVLLLMVRSIDRCIQRLELSKIDLDYNNIRRNK